MERCSHQEFFNPNQGIESLCSIASNECNDYYGLINFFSITYCYLSGSWQLYLILSLFLILYIFRSIQVTVEEYMAPAIQYIAQYFQLPDSLCAITLLALVNGAGDLVAAFVASTQKGGLQYNLGAIYGAGLFVSTIVVGLIITSNKQVIEINPRIFIRDISTYIFSTIVIICFGIYGEISLFTGILLLSIYIGLVFYIGIDEYMKKKRGETTEDQILRQALVNIQLTTFDEFSSAQIQSQYDSISLNQKLNIDETYELESPTTQDRNTFKSIMKIIDIPIQALLFISVPHSPNQSYLKLRLSFFPIVASFVLFIVHSTEIDILFYLIYILPPTMMFCGIIYLTSDNQYQPNYYIIMQLLSIYVCLGWTYLATEILIDSLQTLGMISNLDKTYLGLTILSVGNALPDAITTLAFVRQGQATLGLIGSYTGQLFGLLVGFGLAICRETVQHGKIEFDLFKGEVNTIQNIVIFTTLFILLVTLIAIVHLKGVLNKLFGITLVGVYFIFFVTVTLIAFIQT